MVGWRQSDVHILVHVQSWNKIKQTNNSISTATADNWIKDNKNNNNENDDNNDKNNDNNKSNNDDSDNNDDSSSNNNSDNNKN